MEEKENESKEIDEVSKEVYVDVLSAMIHKAFSQDHRRLTEQSIERKDEFWVAEFKTHIARLNDQECKILLKKGNGISGVEQLAPHLSLPAEIGQWETHMTKTNHDVNHQIMFRFHFLMIKITVHEEKRINRVITRNCSFSIFTIIKLK